MAFPIRGTAWTGVTAQLTIIATGLDFSGGVTVYIKQDGGAFALGTVGGGVCTSDGRGGYSYNPSSAETDGDLLTFQFVGSGAFTVEKQIGTLTEQQAAALAATTGGTSITVRNLIKAALRRINVIQENEDPSGDSLSDSFERFNDWVDSVCGNERLTIYTVTRTTWNLVPSQSVYTIGLGGDVNIVRPQFINQVNWINANLSVPFEQQLTLLTEDAEASLALKSLTSTYPFYAYYNPTYTGALGSLTLWPTVTGTGLQGALYYPQQVNRFNTVNDTIALPPGYNRFMRDSLAIELFPEFREGQQMDPILMQSASEAKANLKRINKRLMDLQTDPQLLVWFSTLQHLHRAMKYPGFIGVSDKTQSLSANPEETINWYYESQPQHAKNTAALYPTPGFSVWVASGASIAQGRALFTENGRTFGVVGKDYGELTINTSGVNTFTRYGIVSYDTNQAQIVTNGSNANQAFVASGTNGYLHDLTTNTLTQELSGDSVMVGMLDGYFAVLDPLTSTMRISALNDGTVWDPTQFVSRSAAPDNWVAMAIVAPDIWLIGSKTGDIWYDAGTFPFPFAPRTGLSYKYGIVAPFTLKASGASLFWLSRNEDGGGIVVRTRGYSPTPISDAAVETAIAAYERDSTITDAESFVYQEEGHTFYILHFPTAKVTWAYDVEENKWAKRSYWNTAMMQDEPWRARVHTYAFGKHLTADFTSANICTMSISIGTESDGSAIRRTRIAPGIFDQKQQIPIRNMEIFLQSGLGIKEGAASSATVLGSDPLVMFTTSDDGGNTYGNERRISAGKIGQYKRRLRMWRMGTPRDRVNKMVVTDPIPWRIIDAFINNDGL